MAAKIDTRMEKQKIQSAVLQFRGMNDAQRAQVLEVTRYKAKNNPLPEVRQVAALLLPLLEEAEKAIQAERRELARQMRYEVNARVADALSGYTYDPDAERRKIERQRGIFAAGVLVAIVGGGYGVAMWIISSGLVPWIIGGGVLLFFLSAMRGGSTETDVQAPTVKPVGGQSIVINISQNGDVTYTSK